MLITRLIGIPGLLLVSRGILHGRAVRMYPRKIGSQSHKSKHSRLFLCPFDLTTFADSLISSPSPPLHLRWPPKERKRSLAISVSYTIQIFHTTPSFKCTLRQHFQPHQPLYSLLSTTFWSFSCILVSGCSFQHSSCIYQHTSSAHLPHGS